MGATPVLVDVNPDTLNIDVDAAAAALTSKTKAVIPVHVSGRPADMKGIVGFAQHNNLFVVEDAAEALMSRHDGRFLGTLGNLGCLSFSPAKIITTGQGGMVLCNDDHLDERLRELKDQGRPVRGTGGDDDHPTLGFNFKLTNLQACVGLAQLECLRERMDRMNRRHQIYQESLKDIE